MRFATLAAVLLAAQPAAGFACTIPFDPRPVEVLRDEQARQSYERAKAMVEVVAVTSSRRRTPGIVRVVRTLKGRIAPGRLLSLRSVDESLCGAGDFRRGSRGLILIDRLDGRLVFQGYLSDDFLTRLDRLGLRPLRASERGK